MGVRKKGRRKIVCNGKIYIWYVNLDYDSPYCVLNIVSEDKTLILQTPLNMTTPYVIVKGNVFQKKKTDGIWHRYLLPFDVPDIVTPKFVFKLISWSTQVKNAVEVKM